MKVSTTATTPVVFGTDRVNLSGPAGIVALGRFKNGLRHGHGKYTFNKGRVYDGEWNEATVRIGVETWPNKDRYEEILKMVCFMGKEMVTRFVAMRVHFKTTIVRAKVHLSGKMVTSIMACGIEIYAWSW